MNTVDSKSINIDYATFTDTSAAGCVALKGLAEEMESRVSRGDGPTRARWSMRGYKGWKRGPVAYGEGEYGVMLMVAGALAQEACETTWSDIHRVRRLDIAYTILLHSPDPGIIERMFDEPPGQVADHRVSKYKSLIKNTDLGETMYLGKRGSDVFCRLYDKGAQSGQYTPGQLLRYEVELKRDVAQAHFDALKAMNFDVEAQASIVEQMFEKRGYPVVGSDAGDRISVDLTAYSGTKELNLGFLSRTVGPYLRKLVEAGYSKDVSRELQFLLIDPHTGEVLGGVSSQESEKQNGSR